MMNLLRYIRYLIYRYFIYRQFKPLKINYNCKLTSVSDKSNSFFGYYNLSPANNLGQILYLVVNDEKKALNSDASIYIKSGLVSKRIYITDAWNWQQGCMLQWLPPNYKNIIFNDYDKATNSYISRVIDIDGKLLYNLPEAIGSISKQGDYALGLNFKRLAKLRPAYGYFKHIVTPMLDNESDGIYFIDLKYKTVKQIVSLQQIIDLNYVNTMKDAVHKVNHIEISPDGNRFMFLHRWIGPQGRYTRLITANRDGGDFFILNGDVMTSHCCWYNSTEIISYCFVEGKGEGYYKFQDKKVQPILISNKLPRKDGHPIVSPDRKLMIFDTYPNKGRLSKLYLYNFNDNQPYKIASLYQPLRYHRDNRIDLHPKLSLDGNHLFFESGHDNKRKLYMLDYKNIHNSITEKITSRIR